MNLFLQAALGLSLTMVLFVIFAIFSKKSRVVNIVMAAFSGAIIVTAVICSFAVKPEPAEVISASQTKGQIEMIYCLAAQEGGMEQAEEMLAELRAGAYDSAELTMCDAYLHAAQGDWQGAQTLYAKAIELGGVQKDPELEELLQKADGAMQARSGEAAELLAAVQEVREYAADVIRERSGDSGKEVRAVAMVLSESEVVFTEYLQYNMVEQVRVDDLIRKMERAIEDDETLLQLDPVRICRAKLLVLGERYEEVAQNIDENATYEELAIVTELYMNGMINDRDLPDEYIDGYRARIEAVYNQLKRVVKKITNKDDKADVEELIEELGSKVDSDSALDVLEYALEDIANDKSDPDSPKAFIQLAKISYYNGDEDKAQGRISSALNTVGVSDDEGFYVPMSKLAEIISNKDNTEDLKNIAIYVDEVIDNTADEVVADVVESLTEETEETEGFDSFMGDTVSKLRISLNITKVDASGFSTVRATINVDNTVTASADELKEMITVTDCGVPITDFTVEKVEYKAANILLCCDVSGSMSGQPMYDLIEAVTTFVETSSDKENIALVTFDDSVDQAYGFTTDKQTLISVAQGLHDQGGTNMFGAVVESLDMFTIRDGELNFILLMSDGADGYSRSDEEMMELIGNPCREDGIVMYTMGIGGSVDIDYMQRLAQTTKGEFVYIADSATMNSFYDTLRSQLLNQYIITFEAQDTMSIERTLEVYLTEDSLSGDVEYYSLDGGESDGTSGGDPIVTFGDRGVYGLDAGLIYKSSKPTTIKVRGFGFEEDDQLSAKLDGKLNYGAESVKCEYVDANTLNLTVPGGIACGEYTVHITVEGQTAVLRNGLSVVVQGSEKTTAFGPYIFTSYEKREENGTTILSGSVKLNGWLEFRGDVSLTFYGNEAYMTDHSGAYVRYYPDTAEGLARTMANNGIKLPIPALGEITLINDPTVSPEAADYPTRATATGIPFPAQVLSLETPGVRLYPNKLLLESDSFTTRLPMQDKILKKSGFEDPFQFDASIAAAITNKSIGIKAEISNDPDENTYSPVNLGSAPIYLAPMKFKVSIDTIKNEYEIDLGTKVAFIDCDGMGLYLKWSERETDGGLQKLVPSEVMLKADVSLSTTIGPVPVTFDDFKLGMSDIDPNKSILDWKLKGQFDFSAVKVSEIVPGLEDYIGDPSVASLDDTTIEFSWGQGYFSVESTLKVLDEITLGKIKLEAGRFSVSSEMLGMESVSAKGIRGELSAGISWQITNCDLDVTGKGIIHLHDKFVGVEMKGEADVDIGWWIFHANFHETGTVVVGVQHENDMPTFVIKVANSDKSGTKGYFLTWNERTKLDYGKIKV